MRVEDAWRSDLPTPEMAEMELSENSCLKEAFERWTRSVLEDNCDWGFRFQAAQDVFSEFGKFAELDATDLMVDAGTVLSSLDASRCLLDLARTSAFVRGLREAVADGLREQKSVEIFYAGCGPFATLVLPLTMIFEPEQLQITLADFNSASLESAQRVLGELSLHRYIRAYRQCDATGYDFETDEQPDIILTETLQRALTKECQVAIASNLVLQRPESVLIPQKIIVSAKLADLGAEVAPGEQALEARGERVHLGDVLTLSTGTLKEWGRLHGRSSIPATSVQLPEQWDPRKTLCLFTEICGREFTIPLPTGSNAWFAA